MAKVTLNIEDATEKSVMLTSESVLNEDQDFVSPALVVSLAIIALYNSGLLLNIGIAITENTNQHPVKTVMEYLNDYTNLREND